MRKTMLMLIAGLGLLFAVPARLSAQLVVYDPVNHFQALARYAQLILTYQQLVAEYKHLVNQARRVPVDMFTRYRAPEVPWRHASAPDTYSANGRWVAGLNYGDAGGLGYRQVTERLDEYGSAMTALAPMTAARARRTYASVELTDGATMAAIHGIGAIRSNALEVERAIAALEGDAFSTNDAMHTQIAVLNKINATTVLALRNQQSTNQLLVHLLEERLLAATRQRDGEVMDINARIRRRMREQEFDRGARAGTADAERGFRVRTRGTVP